MTSVLGSVCRGVQSLVKLTCPIRLQSALSAMSLQSRCYSSEKRPEKPAYDPYTQYDTPSPFMPHAPSYKYGYKYKHYKGGLLPRPKRFEDKPYKSIPKVDRRKRDQWTPEKALFGQNDYIDILGDGTVHPSDLMTGPPWIKRFRGNELQRLVRRMTYEGAYLGAVHPTKFHSIRKQIIFLYKKFNHRRSHHNYWSRGGRNKGRLFNLSSRSR